MRLKQITIIAGFLCLAVAGFVAAFVRPGLFGIRVDASANAAAKQGGDHKQLWHCGMHPQVIWDHPGNCPICHMALTPLKEEGPSTSSNERKILYWWDPMLGPSSISDKPGKSAMGMELVPVYADQAGPKVTIDPTVVQNMGVRTAEVTRGPLKKTVRTIGLLKTREPGLYDVTLKIGGWIDKLYADQEGMHVEAGQPLFELYSQDLLVAEEELISAVKAQRSLGADAAPPVRQDAGEMVESAKRKLRLWDVAEQDIEAIATAPKPPKDVPFRSPATGHMVEKMVVQGSSVQAGMKLMRIEDHSKMWLDAQVYEDQFPVVKIGQEAQATMDGAPGKTFKGQISFTYPHVDHMTRTMTVRITLDNPDFELRPGMYAMANITTEPLADAIQVPREAVIDTGTRQIAFVAEGEGHFDPRKVKMGITGDDDQVQIVEGLAPGEMVVTSGQFLMDVESRTTEAIEKLRKTSATTQSGPATKQATGGEQSLVLAHCPMKNADWLQAGRQIANPYYGSGSAMAGCGKVTKLLAVPQSGDAAKLLQAYLAVEGALASDKLDLRAAKALKAIVDSLEGSRYEPLRASINNLADAKDLQAQRAALKPVTDAVVALLVKAPSP